MTALDMGQGSSSHGGDGLWTADADQLAQALEEGDGRAACPIAAGLPQQVPAAILDQLTGAIAELKQRMAITVSTVSGEEAGHPMADRVFVVELDRGSEAA